MNVTPINKQAALSLVSSVTAEAEQQQDWSINISRNNITSELMQTRHQQNIKYKQATRLATRLTKIIEVLPGGVVVINGEGIVQQSNLAAIDFLGQPLDGEPWSKVVAKAFAPKADDGHNVSLKDGRLLHISTTPLDGEPGQIILLQDVTETQQLQKQISHLQRLSAMGEMAARLAHQIRTPLSSALLFLAPLMKDKVETKLRKRFAQRLHDSISHMDQLVKDMLAFSRGDMVNTAPIAVDEMVNAIAQQMASQPASNNMQLSIHNELSDAYIYGCKEALVSSIHNLINNAQLACDVDGEINLFVSEVKEANQVFVEFTVEDNGHGIAQRDQDKILTPFYTTRSSGTGLGLAVVQSIAKAHKGELWFESEQGEGSTFGLRLPKYQAVPQAAVKTK